MPDARNAGRINVWRSTVDARAAAEAADGDKVLGRMTIWPTPAAARAHTHHDVEEDAYTGPLDIQGGAVVAFSQRRMAAAFSGNVIRIDNGTAAQDFPADNNNEVNQATITAFIAAGTPGAAGWFDQSGNAADLDNIGTMPHWAGSQANGKAAIGNVDNAQLYTTNEVSFPNGEATVFLVCKQNGGNDPLGTEMNFNTSNYVRFRAPNTGGATATQDIYDDGTGNEAFARYDIVASSDYQLWDGAWSIESHSMMLNGVAQTPTSTFDTESPPPSITDQLIMLFGDAGEYMAEIIMYPTVLDDATRLAIRQNIAAFYNITLA